MHQVGQQVMSVALSEDGKTLYIANADNNSLAVFDVSNPGNLFQRFYSGRLVSYKCEGCGKNNFSYQW